MDDFEVFEKYHSRSVKELYITIQKRGIFSLNRASFRAMGSPEYAELLFNRSKRLIGIRPAKSATGRTVPVRRQGQSESYLIAGLTFTKEYDIDCRVSRRYIATMQNNMLVVDLNSPSTEAIGPRSRSEDAHTSQDELFSHSVADDPKAFTDGGAAKQSYNAFEHGTTAAVNKGVDNARTGVDNAINTVLQLDEEQTKAFLEFFSTKRNEQGSKKAK